MNNSHLGLSEVGDNDDKDTGVEEEIGDGDIVLDKKILNNTFCVA